MITQIIAYLLFLISTLMFIYYLVQESIKRYRRRYIQLKKEHKYPIVFVKESNTKIIKSRTRSSASMTLNNFTNKKTGELINTENYLGFIIFGNTEELNLFHGSHGDLIFVRKQYTPKELSNNLIIVCKDNNYLIKKVKTVKDNYVISNNKEKIDFKSVVGPIDFDFTIKL